ncbi:MAG TPA: class I SAM-dependent methyltransferase [Dehalococcoidia bacterium]|nr:class I SAM-dependent methyltransferase [Dehalococcoidia bacterium]
MGLLTLRRVPEPEIMDTDEEVDAYTSAAAQAYLEAIDRTFVDHLGRLIGPSGLPFLDCRVLDFGCGPGQIPILIARRWPGMRIIGADAGPNMIEQAKRDAATAAVDIDWQVVRLGPGGDSRLPYEDEDFDVVLCNSTLHHLDDPLGALDELARVAKPSAAVLIRDLMRPPAPAYPLHVWLFGRHYSGEMRRLYEASVRAAYTLGELQSMLEQSKLNDGRSRVFKRGMTHLSIERAALASNGD